MTGRSEQRAGHEGPQPSNSALAIDFPVVGIGASAGGLDAFKKLFDAMPAHCGMAFVLIQHLDPKHQSMMVDLLAGHTSMRLLQATDGLQIERDHVYLIPPGVYLAIEGSSLRLSGPLERHGARMPFDFFLRSLAHACGERAICAILSGTGTDGSLGLKAVKEQGGLVIVQDPTEAAFDGMPRSAIMSGAADLVLPVAKIPDAIVRFARQPYGKHVHTDTRPPSNEPRAFADIVQLLANQSSHDFSLYKQGTIQRRIERRMAMAGVESSARYLQVLREDSAERELLAKDLLINVTHFFRDAGAFNELAETIIPVIVQRHTQDKPLRIWVPGCSTGEEAYSIAMLFLEQIAIAKRNIKLQMFATDIDSECVGFARSGTYPDSIEADVSPERLARFFVKEDHSYRVVRELRELVVFTVQSLLADPPYSRIDLVSCRNLLIYLSPEAQRKCLSLFHFALLGGGVLFLGSSETVGSASDHFEAISKKHRIYRHLGSSRPGEVEFPHATGAAVRIPIKGRALQEKHSTTSFGELSQRVLLEAYAPASVLINANHEALYYFGAVDRYLKIVPGEGSRDVLAMARDGLRAKLRSTIQRAVRENAAVAITGATVKWDEHEVGVSIVARPIESGAVRLLLVSLVDEAAPEHTPAILLESAGDGSRISQLEMELESAREELQCAVREIEIAAEEQKAINEEAMSVNEEFQSTNEELETSKEELQSLNEELTALNGQLHETVEQQRVASNDLQNILNSTDMATVFLDAELNIRFFTPAAKTLFNVIASDIGRPLADLTRRFEDDEFVSDARKVLASHTAVRREVKAHDGSWFMRGMLPYRSDDSAVKGVVVTFASIAEMKAAEHAIEAARAYLDSIIATVHQPLIVLDDDLRVISASSSFYRAFSLASESLIGQHLLTVADFLDVPVLRSFLTSIQASDITIEERDVELDLPGLGRRNLSMSARVLREAPTAKRKLLIAMDDVTEAKREGKILEEARAVAERANAGKSRFLAAASHDLRQPLQTISLLQGMLEKRVQDEATLKLVHRLDETVAAMSSMLDKLLDINQLEAGVVRAEIADFPVKRLLEAMKAEFAIHTSAIGLALRVVPCTLTARSDVGLLEQIIRNLLSNAVKYTTKGKILLGCRRQGDKLRIEVWDTGPGIPERERQAIFEEFHQLDNPARERNKGLGLGLAIVQRLADLLGHKVDIRSRLGAGSVFAIEVPLGRANLEDIPDPMQNEIPVGLPLRGTILIVEDDPAIREMLELLFDAEGLCTIVAADGHTALTLASQSATAPDLIVADYNLPNGLNGLETIARLQAQAKRAIPSIILSGDISTDSIREISSCDSVQLSKPVKASELTQLAQHMLARSASPGLNGIPELRSQSLQSGLSTVFIVDDDRALREAMGEVIRQYGYVIELFGNASSFFEGYRPDRKGCLLVDALMPGMSGIELIQRLKREGHNLPAIVITGNGAVPMAVEAMKAGAVDFIEKPVGSDELRATIERAIMSTQDASVQSAARATAAVCIAGLTSRQRQILDLVLAGHPSKNIAADLGISQRTVDNHRAAIMKKTGSKSMPALVRTALAAA